MAPQIRSFIMSDYDQVRALWEESEGLGLHDDVDSREGIASYLARNPGLSSVAWDADRVVGAVLAGHDGRRGYLHHLAVHPSARRTGLGRRLVQASLDALRREDIAKAHIFVFRDNAAGQRFWESCGWHRREELDIMSIEISERE
jgi:N-acetylglutamate synthase